MGEILKILPICFQWVNLKNFGPNSYFFFNFQTRPQDDVHFFGPAAQHTVYARMWTTPQEAELGSLKEFGFLTSFTKAVQVNKMDFYLHHG